MLLLFFIAIVLSFLLSGLETAVLSVSRVRVRHAANEGSKRAAILLPLLDDRDGLLGALTIANHIANVSAFGFITWQLVNTFGSMGYVLGFLLALPIFIIGLEVLPKNLFRRYPFRALTRSLPIIQAAAVLRGLFRPIRAIAAGEEGALTARNDISVLLNDMTARKLIPASATEIIKRVLSSKPVVASAVMLPLDKVASIPADAAAEAARHMAREHHFSSLLVSDPAQEGHFLGMINTVNLPPSVPPDRLVRQHTLPIDHVDAATPALAVLQRLRRRGMSMALVTSGSDNKPIGLVTEEDIISTLLPLPIKAVSETN